MVSPVTDRDQDPASGRGDSLVDRLSGDRAARLWTVIGGVVTAVTALIVALGLLFGGGSSPSAGPPAAAPTGPAERPSTTTLPPTSSTASTPPTPTSVSTPAPTITYIEDLEYAKDTDPYDGREIASIAGEQYSHSQGARFCYGDDDRVWDYNLGKQYDRFRAIVGLDDKSASEATVRFEIFADGRSVFLEDATLGQSYVVDESVSDVLRLRLVTTLLSKEGRCGAATAQWANVRAES